MQELKKFSILDVNVDNFADDEDEDFAIARVGFLASGDNGQDSPIDEEVLKRDAYTVLGKPIVAKYNPYENDAGSHETDEVIVGWFPSDGKVEFEKLKDGRLMAYANAVISKIYGNEIYQLFKTDNYRAVSSEFTCTQERENEFGEGEGNILSFDIRGVTILGKRVLPAVDGANIQMKKFSLDSANKIYDVYNNPLKKFAEDRRKSMEEKKKYKYNCPVDTSKEAVDVGDWNGDKAKHDLMDSENYDSIGDKVCLDFTKGERKLENCKYPVMNIKNNKWVYNAEGISSAMAYGAQHDETVYNKTVALQKKLGLVKDDDKGDTKKMTEKKFEIEGREAWGDIIKKVQDHEGKDAYVESVEKDHIIYKVGKDGERMVVKANVKVGKDDKSVSADIDWATAKKDKDQKEFSDKVDDAEDKKDVKDREGDDSKAEEFADKKKKFSLDAYADNGAFMEMLSKETDENKALAKELMEQDDMNVIMSKLFELNTQCMELKKFKDSVEMAEVKETVDRTLADVKDKVDENSFCNFSDEAKTCTKDNVEKFVAKVKAFAYDSIIKETKKDYGDGIMTFAFGDSSARKQTKDVFDTILNK